MVPIAVAPVFGHAFSPFLKFRGGKSIATTFGIWSGLTLWECPTLLGIVFIFLKFVVRIKQDAWVVLIGMSGVLIYILFRLPRLELFLILGFNTLILVIKHWHDLLIRL
ncbi:MAG: glycerol-3-phosphate acyltransferase [candidate division WOR-3 bacterium]